MTRCIARQMRLPGTLIAGAILAGLGACNIVGPIALVLEGPPKIDRVYELDRDRPTVIFIDDRGSALPRRSLRTVIAQEAEAVLIEENVVRQENMYTHVAAHRVAETERYGEPMSIAEIGEAVGAEVVIFVQMRAWTQSPDGASVRPEARGVVKVIDVANNVRLFPPGQDAGYPLVADLPVRVTAGPMSSGEVNMLDNTLAERTGLMLARMFFTYEKEGVSSRIDR